MGAQAYQYRARRISIESHGPRSHTHTHTASFVRGVSVRSLVMEAVAPSSC